MVEANASKGAPIVAPAEDAAPRPWLPVIFTLGLVPLHLLLISATVGLRAEHFVVDGAFITLFWAHKKTARFAALVLPFWGVGFAYEALPLILPLRGDIHVGDLLAAEIALFGVDLNGTRVTPAAWWQSHTNPVFDAVCGFAYITYLGEAFLFAGYLFFKDQVKMSTFVWGFFTLNLLGMITYVLYPAAPPWYVDLHGVGPAIMDAKPSPAGAARFDALFGVQWFQSFYSRNANVFGAMPSLHSAYPTLVACIAARMGLKLAIPTTMFALLIMFSAVYLNHHYVLDVIAGVGYAIVTFLVLDAVAKSLTRDDRARKQVNGDLPSATAR